MLPSRAPSLLVFDLTDPHDPELEGHALHGRYCLNLEVSEDSAYCALRDHGAQAIALTY